ncbi:hypothetical protein AGMMS49587_17030 [Spirochaetia bacterium]|nr:hypothetical protein AGMMS49587_17030 [Spirochaetia bacterium]
MKTETLKKEIERWEAEGIITADQRKRILSLYPENRSGAPVMVIFAVIGSVLVGAGIILIFATNWYKLPVPAKLSLAFLPLTLACVLGAYTVLRRYSSAAFREASGMFISLAVFAAVALVGQTFHTPRDLPVYILACVLLTLPGIYLLQAHGIAAIYVAGAAYTLWHYPVPAALLLFCAPLPFIVIRILRSDNRPLLSYLMLLLSASLVNIIIYLLVKTEALDWELAYLFIALTAAQALLLLDAAFRRWGRIYVTNSAKIFGTGTVFAVLVIGAATSSWFHEPSAEAVSLWLMTILPLCLTTVYIVLRYRYIKPSGASALASVSITDFCMAVILLLILILPHAWIWLPSNILLFACGVYYIQEGSRKLALTHLNRGMLLLMYIIVLRFFDWEASLLVRGILFILLGICFLVCNFIISRKKKGRQS